MIAGGRSEFSATAFSVLRGYEDHMEYISSYVCREAPLDHSVESVCKSLTLQRLGGIRV